MRARFGAQRWWFFCAALVVFAPIGCAQLPKTAHLPKSVALSERVAFLRQNDPKKALPNRLKQAIDEQERSHGNLSGYYPIATGANAFASRRALSAKAQTSIDIQYYIWHNDEAGQLMLKDLWEAADRGVVVRLLLDDFNSDADLDATLRRFASHPNIAVRLVNPGSARRFRALNFITQPKRMNTRMHNKSMIFDGVIAVIGGRNIGNEYLNNDTSNNFADLDTLLVGPVVDDISDSFEDYWNLPVAYDIETLVSLPERFAPPDFVKSLDKLHAKTEEHSALQSYRRALQDSTLGEDLAEKRVAFRWARIDFLVDDAKKLTNDHKSSDLLVYKLRQAFGVPQSEFSAISAYFVPTKDGVDDLIRLANQGVKVRILTNSYGATDVGAVHAGYAHWRKALLKVGVELYELKPTAKKNSEHDGQLWRSKGQTTTSLHAKAFAVDSHKVFIGSYNIDPRSANINSELGVMIHDDALAQKLHRAFDDNLLKQAYKVQLQGDKLRWHTVENGVQVWLDKEPHMNLDDRLAVAFLAKLPIDWLL